LATIRAKVEWRWNNGYRAKAIISPVPVQGNFDSNITVEEMTFLSSKLANRGLDQTRPFGVFRYQDGEHRGFFRVVRIRDDENYPGPHSSPVRPSVEFRAFLNSLT
jgi:hypothetical protein